MTVLTGSMMSNSGCPPKKVSSPRRYHDAQRTGVYAPQDVACFVAGRRQQLADPTNALRLVEGFSECMSLWTNGRLARQTNREHDSCYSY